MRRRKLLVAAIAMRVAGVIGFWLWPAPPPGVTVENFRRLRDGITVDQVGEIFGRPYDRKEQWDNSPGSDVLYWYAPIASFVVYVEPATGRVHGGEIIWTNLERHTRENLGETSWARWFDWLVFGDRRVLD